MHNYLFIINSSPLTDYQAQEQQELILTFAALEQPISLLFQGMGILQLTKKLSPNSIDRKDFLKVVKAYDLYEINNIYVNRNDMLSHDIKRNSLIHNISIINSDEIMNIINNHSIVTSL